MRLPRYTAGRSNVGMLEQERNALQSPQEAANAAGLGYKLGGELAGIAAETALKFDEVKRARQLEADKITYALGEANRTAAYNMMSQDPALAEKMEADPEYFANSLKDINKQYTQGLTDLGDHNTRKGFQSLAETSSIKFLSQARVDLDKVEFSIGKNRGEAGIKATLDSDDVDGAELMYEASKQFLNPVEEAQWEAKITDKRLEVASVAVAADVETAYLKDGMAGGEKAYDELINDTDLPAELKKKSILAATVHRQNFMRSQADEEDREKGEVIRTKTVYGAAAEVGEFSHANNDLALSNLEYGKDPKSSSAIAAWSTVFNKIDTYQKKQVGVLNVADAVTNGRILDPSKANRLLLDGYMEQQAEVLGMEVDSDEYFRLAANTAQATGTLPRREQLGLNGGYVSKEQAQKYFQLWSYLKDNDQLKPNLGLSDKANTMYMAMDSLVEYGTSPESAIEVIWNARDLKPADKDALDLDYGKEDDYTKTFKTLINTDFFDAADPTFSISFGPETETKMGMRYAEVRKAVYMATNGNIAAATDAADKAIKAGWGPSNFGNSDPSHYTIQENPLGKDMSTFQDIIISELNGLQREGDFPAAQAGVTFNAYTDEGYKQTKVLDKEAISFHEIPQMEENRRDGVRRYQVWHNGRPVVNMDTGMVMDFPITSSDARNITRVSDMKKQRADEVERIQDRIGELESTLSTRGELGGAKEFGISSGKDYRKEDLEAELAGLKRSLPEAKTRRDETKYSVYAMFPESQSPKVFN
jgi:hypothetical protein